MKNLFFILVGFVGMSITVNAQTTFGIKTSVGVTIAPNETTYVGDVFDYINHEISYKGTNIVKSVGLFGQKKVGYLYGRAEISYANFSQEYNVRSFIQFGQGMQKVYEKFEYIDVQIMGGITHNNLRLGVGPVAHVLVGHTQALDFISGYNDNLRGVTFGFTTAVGLDAGMFHLDVRYVNNFRTVGDHISYGNRGSGFKVKPHVVNFTIGISI